MGGDVLRCSLRGAGAEAMLSMKDRLHNLSPHEGGLGFDVWRVKNTHHPDAQTVGGYRDIKVLGLFTAPATEAGQQLAMIAEVQILDVEFIAIKKCMHKVYAIQR